MTAWLGNHDRPRPGHLARAVLPWQQDVQVAVSTAPSLYPWVVDDAAYEKG